MAGQTKSTVLIAAISAISAVVIAGITTYGTIVVSAPEARKVKKELEGTSDFQQEIREEISGLRLKAEEEISDVLLKAEGLKKELLSKFPSLVLFAEVSDKQEIQGNEFKNIKGLRLELPPGNSIRKYALVALNVPSPYAMGNNFPGGEFAVAANGTIVGRGWFTCDSRELEASGRHPFTLIVRVKLANDSPTRVTAQWRSVRNAKCRIDSFASISAILG